MLSRLRSKWCCRLDVDQIKFHSHNWVHGVLTYRWVKSKAHSVSGSVVISSAVNAQIGGQADPVALLAALIGYNWYVGWHWLTALNGQDYRKTDYPVGEYWTSAPVGIKQHHISGFFFQIFFFFQNWSKGHSTVDKLARSGPRGTRWIALVYSEAVSVTWCIV